MTLLPWQGRPDPYILYTCMYVASGISKTLHCTCIYERTALSAEIMLQNILRKSFEFRARWHLNNSCHRSDCCWDTSSYQRSWERITRYIIFMWSDLDVDLRRRATQQHMTTSTISTTTPPPIIAPRISEIKRHSTLRQRRGVQQLSLSEFLNTYTMGACHLVLWN